MNARADRNSSLSLLEILSITLLGTFVLSKLWSVSYFYIYQLRDLDRATLLAQGNLLLFGPETNGGGNLPGPFYYFLIAAPLALGLDWRAAWVLMILLAAAGAALLWRFSRRNFGDLTAAVGVFLYLSCPTLLFLERQFYNPSFAPLFLTFALINLCRAYSAPVGAQGFAPLPARPPERAWIAYCVTIGLCFQLHFSTFLVFLASIFLQLASPWIGLRKLHWRAFLKGLLALVLVLSPFFLFVALDALGVTLGRPRLASSGGGMNAPRDLMDTFVREWGLAVHGSRHSLKGLTIRTVFFLGPLLLLAWVFAAHGAWKKRAREIAQGPREFRSVCLRVLGTVLLFTLPSALYVVFFPARSRYGVSFVLTLSVYSAVLIGPLLSRLSGLALSLLVTLVSAAGAWIFAPKDSPLPVAAGGILAALGVAAVVGLGGLAGRPGPWNIRDLRSGPRAAWLATLFLLLTATSFAVDFSRFTFLTSHQYPFFDDYISLASYVKTQTGWNYDEARKRIYYLNHFNQANPRLVWDTVASQIASAPAGASRPDGYFAILHDPSRRLFASINPFGEELQTPTGPTAMVEERLEQVDAATRFRARFRREDLETSLHQGIRDRKIVIGEVVELTPRFGLAPYWVTDRQTLPGFFQNIGYPYEKGKEWGPLYGPMQGTSEARRLEDGSALFRWRECPSGQEFCTVGARVRLSPRKTSHATESWAWVQIQGEPLAVPAINTIPDWTQALRAPFLEVSCDGKTHVRRLADAVGYYVPDLSTAQRVHTNSHTLLAPIEAWWKTPCRGPVTKVAFGWEGSEVTRSLEQTHETGRRLEIKL